ncbi:MAG: hypothetical protein RLO01_08855 [Thalassobaculaceae bacterium]
MTRQRHKPESLDTDTRRSLTVLADATAEVVGRGDVYEAIVKVAKDGSEGDFETARDKFDHMEVDDRAKIRAQAIDSLEEGEVSPNGLREPRNNNKPQEEPEQLDWAKQMMGNFPKLSEGLDGDK